MKSLLRGSQRNIKYVIPAPLIKAGIGKNETAVWTEKMVGKLGPNVKVNPFKINALNNVYLLCSGHPVSCR